MRQSTAQKLDFTPAYYDDRYELDSTIGRGRGSVVYRARRYSRDETLGHDIPPVALKVLLGIESNPTECIKRIKREALALLSCIFFSVIRIYDYVAREDTCYLSMEYAEFGDLRRLFERDDTILSPRAVLRLVQGILRGVESVHRAGILHRDLKPENFLLTRDYQVKIADFSVCLLRGELSEVSLVNQAVGTFDYVAPECLRGGHYSKMSDLYAVGVSAYEMLCGYLPSGGETIKQVLHSKTHGVIRDIPADIVKELPSIEDFFKIALSPVPEERYQNADQMLEAINRVLLGTFNSEITTNGPRSSLGFKNPKLSKQSFWKVLNGIQSKSESDRLNIKLDFFSIFRDFKIALLKKIKRGIKFLFLSFFLTLFFSLSVYYGESIYFVFKNTLSNELLVNELVHYETEDAAPSKDELPLEAYAMLSTNAAFGRLSDLYTKGRDYRFTIYPDTEGTVLFGLAVEGWQPIRIKLDSLQQNNYLEVKGKGLHVLLKPEDVNSEKMSGTFENKLLNSKGEWSLKIMKE